LIKLLAISGYSSKVTELMGIMLVLLLVGILFKSHKSKVKSQKSKVKSQKSKVKSQKSKVKKSYLSPYFMDSSNLLNKSLTIH